MLTLRNDRSIRALAVGFGLLALSVGAAIWIFFVQRDAFDWVQHTLRVEMRLAAIDTHLQQAESAQRGYILTQDEAYLRSFDAALAKLPTDMHIVRALVRDNPVQIKRADELNTVVALRRKYLLQVLALDREGRVLDPALLRRGRVMMDRVEALIQTMRNEERKLLEQRNAYALYQWQLGMLGLVFSVLVMLVLGIFALRHARSLLVQMVASRDAHAVAHQQLLSEVSQRHAAEEQMRQMQKTEALGQLTGGIAHDFNNMLGVVIGSLDIAQRRLGNEAEPRALRSLDNAMEGAKRAAQLTARLLAFSRQQPLEPQALDANRLVSGMSDLLHRTTGDHIRVETVTTAGIWTCFADTSQLENALLNLAVNARDAMPDGGRMTIETANVALDDRYAQTHAEVRAGQYVMISVSDTGTGMSDDVIARAFDPFFTTKGVGKGTGLGLSQVFGFVKQSQGHVKIYSEVNQGTTVKIYLPRYYGSDVAQEPAGSEPARDSLPHARANEAILVVEDEVRVRHISVEALRDLGYHIIQAGDATQALALLAIQPRIDLLFTDIVMPDINGRRLAEMAVAQYPHLKVLYTTGYTRNAIVHNGMLDPGLNFLAKPFTIEQLAVKVRQVLDGN
jgi:signal transduction histidine kinase/CheY-like chemotaxis protein